MQFIFSWNNFIRPRQIIICYFQLIEFIYLTSCEALFFPCELILLIFIVFFILVPLNFQNEDYCWNWYVIRTITIYSLISNIVLKFKQIKLIVNYISDTVCSPRKKTSSVHRVSMGFPSYPGYVLSPFYYLTTFSFFRTESPSFFGKYSLLLINIKYWFSAPESLSILCWVS